MANNKGASVPDTQDRGDRVWSIEEWKKQTGIDASQQSRLVKLSHMRYQHPDLQQITTFLNDFGMTIVKQNNDEIWYRGYGEDPYVYYARRGPKKFLGGAFLAESLEDLQKASKIEGASEVQELKDAPGGGYIVTLHDPEGNPVNLIYGQTLVKKGPEQVKITPNYPHDKPRLREFLRFEQGPAAVHKLGHFGYTVVDYAKQSSWYFTHFNLVPSDLLYVDLPTGEQKVVSVFMHIDRGSEYVDHHSVFLSEAEKAHVHHCSFEVHDSDTQHLGHQWLAKKGYRSVWGVGRHILGSQIFDYWWDTTGNMVEHYADGDQVNADTPVGWKPAGLEGLSVWGPDVPQAFLE